MIETERLILRNYTLSDFDSLYEIMSDPETMQHYPAPLTRTEPATGSPGTWTTMKNTVSVSGRLC